MSTSSNLPGGAPRPRYRAPGRKRLQELLHLSPVQARCVRQLLHGTRDPDFGCRWLSSGVRQQKVRCKAMRHRERLVDALDKVCGTHGAVVLQPDSGLWAQPHRWPRYEYLNAGGTYTPTLIIDHEAQRAFISTWGGEAERLERAGCTAW